MNVDVEKLVERRVRVAMLRGMIRRGWRPPDRPMLSERGRDRLIEDIGRIGSSQRGVSFARAQSRALELTDRERVVLTLAARGNTYGEIAAKLGVSEETVRRQIADGRGRLGARNIAHAVAIALTRGIIEFEEEEATDG